MNKLEATEELRELFGDKVANSYNRQAKDYDEPNLSQAILGAFDWENSIEGGAFWNSKFRYILNLER